MAAIYQESSQQGTGPVSGVDEAGWLQQMVSGVDDLDDAEVHAYAYGARRVVVQCCTFMNAVRARPCPLQPPPFSPPPPTCPPRKTVAHHACDDAASGGHTGAQPSCSSGCLADGARTPACKM